MLLTPKDVIMGSSIGLTSQDINEYIKTSQHISLHIIDRKNLHTRDYLERFLNVLQGEIAEQMVLKWLHKNGKFAESAVDKTSDKPDPGHDIHIKYKDGKILTCSIKSSLSLSKGVEGILKEFTLATEEKELRDVNIQVYFWLDIHGNYNDKKNRHGLPNTNNSAIIGWAAKSDLTEFASYTTEQRTAPVKRLSDIRKMENLLTLLK